MQIAVVVATRGRAQYATKLLENLVGQSRVPDTIVFVVSSEDDAPSAQRHPDLRVLRSESSGSSKQRNVGLDEVEKSSDVVVFFDDDFVPARDYIEAVEAIFTHEKGVVGITGKVLLDGVTGPGIAYVSARKTVDDYSAKGVPNPMDRRSRRSLYGCNMAIRTSALHGLRFDERLPLYGWLEDVDFTYQLRSRGDLIESGRVFGVHMGVKAGRTSGVLFGYSQIANPVYLVRKGTAPPAAVIYKMVRNVVINHFLAVTPEPWIDRRGRAKGNWLALLDAFRGRLRPERIVEL